MPIVGHTRVLPQLLSETRAVLAAAWAAGVKDVPTGS
jgi:ATP adenylyltransferase